MTPKNWKKPKKVAQNRPQPLFSTVQPRPQPKIDFPYYEISGPDICSYLCWDFLKITDVMLVHIHEMVHTNLFELVLCTDHNHRGNFKRFIVKPKLLRAGFRIWYINPARLLCIRVRSRFFDQVGHETMYAHSDNKHFSPSLVIVRLIKIMNRADKNLAQL